MTEQKMEHPGGIDKPASVTVFGVLNIVFGGIGLLFSVLATFGLMTAGDASKMASGYRIFLLFMNVIGFGFSIWLLILGIGLLAMKVWARNGSVIYACLGILLFVIEAVVNNLAMSHKWITLTKNAMGEYLGGLCIGLVGGFIYPVLLLIFMFTAKVRQAFQARGQSA